MQKDKQSISPIILADRLTPWWMRRIKEFDGVEIWPCKTVDINGHDNAVMCKPEEATMWAVYGYKSAKEVASAASLELFAQFADQGEAERFCYRLRVSNSHLDKKSQDDDLYGMTSRPSDPTGFF